MPREVRRVRDMVDRDGIVDLSASVIPREIRRQHEPMRKVKVGEVSRARQCHIFFYTATGKISHVVITTQTQKRKAPSRMEINIAVVTDHLMTWRALNVSARRTPQLKERRSDRSSGTSQNGSPPQTPSLFDAFPEEWHLSTSPCLGQMRKEGPCLG